MKKLFFRVAAIAAMMGAAIVACDKEKRRSGTRVRRERRRSRHRTDLAEPER